MTDNGDRLAEVVATDREMRADVPSLDALQQRRRELVAEHAPLSARFGGSRGQGSPMDAIRKRHRSLIMQKIAIEMKQEWEKTLKPGVIVGTFVEPAENKLERMANAHIDHIAFCDAMEKECTRYEVLSNEIREINEQIQSRQAELYSYNKEIGLQ